MQLWALVDRDCDLAIGVFIRRSDAQQALVEILAVEPEWEVALTVQEVGHA